MKNRRSLSFIIVLSFALALAGCGSDKSTVFVPVNVPVEMVALSVEPVFTNNGADWNDYVVGGNIGNAADIACNPDTDTQCIHAGGVKTIEASGFSNCTNLRAEDFLHAFNWTCSDNTGTAVFTGELRSDVGLSELIDFGALSWKNNYVVLLESEDIALFSDPGPWWGNPIVANTTGGELGESGTVYVVPTDVTGNFSIIANNVSLVAAPGAVIYGTAANTNSVEANVVDFSWLDRMEIDSSDTYIGLGLDMTRFSMVRKLYVHDTISNHGIFLHGSSGCRMRSVVSENNGAHGIYIYQSDNNSLSDFTANGNTDGILMLEASNNTLEDIKTSDNSTAGIYLSGVYYSTLRSVYTSGSNYGIYMNGAYYSLLNGITAEGNIEGIYLYGGSGSYFANITSSNNSTHGLDILGPSNTFTNITASGNGTYGINLMLAEKNTMRDLKISKSTYGLYLTFFSARNIFSGVKAVDCSYGMSLNFGSDNNRISDAVFSNNNIYGIYLNGSNSNIFTGITLSGNKSSGIYSGSSSKNTFSAVAAPNNAQYGTYMTSSSNNNYSGFLATDSIYGIYMTSSSENYFTGALKVGNNSTKNCYVSGSSTPGLIDDTCSTTGLTGSYDYGLGNFSDALLTNSVTVATSYVANITSGDSINPSDTENGTAFFGDIDNWTDFENAYRVWGPYSTNTFPNSAHQGACNTGTCVIWDWSALASDTVIVNSLSYPETGDIANTLTHVWTGSAGNQPACDTFMPGSTWNSTYNICETTLLRNAMEIMGDGEGNENTLCEDGEVCLYTPNIGAYQGHGAIKNSPDTFVSGVLTGITLKQYETNGY